MIIVEHMEKQIEKLLRCQNFSKVFRIYDNKLKNVDNIAAIKDLPLKKLNLSNMNAQSMFLWLSSFQNSNVRANLKNLVISNSEINLETANIIIDLTRGLTLLELRNCNAKCNELIAIIGAAVRSGIQTLLLRALIFDVNGTEALINSMTNSRLINLHIDNCVFEQNKLGLLINSIARAHMKLQTLSLAHTYFDDEAMVAIENCIENSQLIILSLIGCIFFNRRIIMVMKAVQRSSVQYLKLCGSFFDDNVGDITECIKKSHVTKFIIGERKIPCAREEIVAVANLIEENNLLNHISFSSAFIYDETLPIICNAIENSTMTGIDLCGCRLNDDRIIKICTSIKKSFITSIALSNNYFSPVGITAICDLLENHNLKKLKLVLCGLCDVSIEPMLASIEKSELIKFNVNYNTALTKPVRQRIKQIMLAQQLRMSAFHKTKSAKIILQ